MTEEEMYQKDLHTIYELIRVHAEMNNIKSSKPEEPEVYIDNIKF